MQVKEDAGPWEDGSEITDFFRGLPQGQQCFVHSNLTAVQTLMNHSLCRQISTAYVVRFQPNIGMRVRLSTSWAGMTSMGVSYVTLVDVFL